MDWLFITFIAIFALLVILIVAFLVSLVKRGDERYEHVRTKAMANSFIATAVILVARLCLAVFNVAIFHESNQGNTATSDLSLLIVIAIIFLVSLVWQKRKYSS